MFALTNVSGRSAHIPPLHTPAQSYSPTLTGCCGRSCVSDLSYFKCYLPSVKKYTAKSYVEDVSDKQEVCTTYCELPRDLNSTLETGKYLNI